MKEVEWKKIINCEIKEHDMTQESKKNINWYIKGEEYKKERRVYERSLKGEKSIWEKFKLLIPQFNYAMIKEKNLIYTLKRIL